jgi:pantoate--beta-alanine ligase
MVADLELGIGIEGVPTVREADGLALSSRNVYLSADDRRAAIALSRALFAGRDMAGHGALAVIDTATHELAREPGIAVDYLQLLGDDLGEIPHHGPARLLVAARVGTTRLIDNVAVEI